MIIFIPKWRPSTLNELMHCYWPVKAKKKKADRQMIFLHTRGLPEATGKRSVELEIILGKYQKAADVDAYFKSTLDALVAARMLKDDSAKYCELKPMKYSKDWENWGTKITLSDC